MLHYLIIAFSTTFYHIFRILIKTCFKKIIQAVYRIFLLPGILISLKYYWIELFHVMFVNIKFANITGSLVDSGAQDVSLQYSDFLIIFLIEVCSKIILCEYMGLCKHSNWCYYNAIIIIILSECFWYKDVFVKSPSKGLWTLENIVSNPLTINVTANSSFDISSSLRDISSEGFFYPLNGNPVSGEFC